MDRLVLTFPSGLKGRKFSVLSSKPVQDSVEFILQMWQNCTQDMQVDQGQKFLVSLRDGEFTHCWKIAETSWDVPTKFWFGQVEMDKGTFQTVF